MSNSLHTVRTTPGFCSSEENRLKLGFLGGSWNKMQEFQSITSENGIYHGLVPNLATDHTSCKKILGRKVLLVGGITPSAACGTCRAWAKPGMLDGNSIPWCTALGAVSLPGLGYTQLAQPGVWWCPSRGFPNGKCARVFLGVFLGRADSTGMSSLGAKARQESPRGIHLILVFSPWLPAGVWC